jgi:hypothetical protein
MRAPLAGSSATPELPYIQEASAKIRSRSRLALLFCALSLLILAKTALLLLLCSARAPYFLPASGRGTIFPVYR